MNIWPTKASSYTLEQCIGIGNYGLVWKAQVVDQDSPKHGDHVAIKMINMEKLPKEESMDELRREIIIINKCNHTNILKYFVSFINDTELWLVLPLVECGSLANVIKEKAPNGIKNEVLLASIMKQIVEGLTYFHSKGLIHRDIKADNILVHSNGRLLIGDFDTVCSIKNG